MYVHVKCRTNKWFLNFVWLMYIYFIFAYWDIVCLLFSLFNSSFLQIYKNTVHENTETATRGVLCKKVFLEVSKNSQENTCARASFNKNYLKTLLKKRLWHRCFPVNFVKFLWTPFLQNTSGRLLLKICLVCPRILSISYRKCRSSWWQQSLT